jgi:hypothetical protein
VPQLYYASGGGSPPGLLRLSAALLFAVFVGSLAATAASASFPAYASEGAQATYTAEGGFIPFFSGVSGNITYSVAKIYSNGSMLLHVYENITAGTDLPPFITVLNITDSVQNPRTFPAVPLSNLSSSHITFQNTSANFVQNTTTTVPAGRFDTFEFAGTSVNGTAVQFWFDRSTGLVVEMSSGTSVMELDSSNFAPPSSPLTVFDTVVPFLLIFVLAWVVGGGSFLWLRHHYRKPVPQGKGSEGQKP